MFVLLEVNLINGLMHLKHAIKHRHHCKESTCLGPWVPKYLSILIPNRNSGPDYTFVHWLQPWRNKFIPPCFNTFVFNLSVNKMADLQWIGFMISCHNIASSGWIFIPNHRFRGLSDHPPPSPHPPRNRAIYRTFPCCFWYCTLCTWTLFNQFASNRRLEINLKVQSFISQSDAKIA